METEEGLVIHVEMAGIPKDKIGISFDNKCLTITGTREEIEANILSALGGRAAEEIQFNQLTTGAASDFQSSTALIRAMICDYGMNDELGQVIYSQNRGEYIYSQETSKKIDSEVKRLVDMYYTQAKQLLLENKDKLDALSQGLLEKETMYAGEIYKLLGIEPREEHLLH